MTKNDNMVSFSLIIVNKTVTTRVLSKYFTINYVFYITIFQRVSI